MVITDRQKEILKVIVEEYIKTAKAVSSNHICKKLKCSSATIRNEMVILEDYGYLEKNHFASGRIPSEKGYKYYVDNNVMPSKDIIISFMKEYSDITNSETLNRRSSTVRGWIEWIIGCQV